MHTIRSGKSNTKVFKSKSSIQINQTELLIQIKRAFSLYIVHKRKQVLNARLFKCRNRVVTKQNKRYQITNQQLKSKNIEL